MMALGFAGFAGRGPRMRAVGAAGGASGNLTAPSRGQEIGQVQPTRNVSADLPVAYAKPADPGKAAGPSQKLEG
jgi:hypothetical protein